MHLVWTQFIVASVHLWQLALHVRSQVNQSQNAFIFALHGRRLYGSTQLFGEPSIIDIALLLTRKWFVNQLARRLLKLHLNPNLKQDGSRSNLI